MLIVYISEEYYVDMDMTIHNARKRSWNTASPYSPQKQPSLLTPWSKTSRTVRQYISAASVSSVQLFIRVQLFCNPVDCSTPDFPVHHQLPELAQTHVHRVGDAN